MIGATVMAAVLGSLAWWGLPRLISKKISRNESKAIAFMKNLTSAQAQIQASGAIDVDRNGIGEYGFLGELAATIPIRGGSRFVEPPVVRRNGLELVRDGIYRCHGYYFQIFLPGGLGTPPRDETDGVSEHHRDRVHAPTAEVFWWALAWPVWNGFTGRRSFFVNQAGDVLSGSDWKGVYSGLERRPRPDAAKPLEGAGAPHWSRAVNTTGRSGFRWTVV